LRRRRKCRHRRVNGICFCTDAGHCVVISIHMVLHVQEVISFEKWSHKWRYSAGYAAWNKLSPYTAADNVLDELCELFVRPELCF
jgi:hypothetical protein